MHGFEFFFQWFTVLLVEVGGKYSTILGLGNFSFCLQQQYNYDCGRFFLTFSLIEKDSQRHFHEWISGSFLRDFYKKLKK